MAVALALPALSACSGDDPDITIDLCGNLDVPEDIDSVRVSVYDRDQKILREGVRELWTCPGPVLSELPQTLHFGPVDGDIFVRVQGLKDGAPVIENTLRTTFNEDHTQATVSLEQGCMGAQCAPGETCVRGDCEPIALAADTVSSCSGLLAAPRTGETDETDDAGEKNATDNGAYLCPEDARDAGSTADAADADETP